ncbi:MAG: ABC transporter ATP-binding protein [Anaerolineales bacterium]
MNHKDLVTVSGLKKYFPVEQGMFRQTRCFIHAVDGVNFSIPVGESLSLVGESGCGKTTTGKLLVKLHEPTGGSMQFNDGQESMDLAHLERKSMRSFRRKAQMIFQDPYESLNPRMTVFDAVIEPLNVQNIGNWAERERRVADTLALVGLTPPSTFLFRFPHELSGGQRQRVAIARALVVNPIFVVADEPTSMLDVSIRTGVMNLMLELGDRFNLSYLYITHDLAVARYMGRDLAVMYLGKIVETGNTEEVLAHGLHPYTQALLSAVPVPDPQVKRAAAKIKGRITAPINPPVRCRFFDRCPISDDYCLKNDHPPLEDKGAGHFTACYKV